MPSRDPWLDALDEVQQSAGPDRWLSALDAAQRPQDQRSIFARAYDAAFTPPEVVTRAANSLANTIDPALTLADAEAIERAPHVFGIPLSPRAAQAYVAGTVQGAANLLTPGDVALTATGYGPLARVVKGVRGGARAVEGLQQAANIATAVRGVERMADSDSTSEALAGASQALLGAAGAKSSAPHEAPPARRPVRGELPAGTRFVVNREGQAVPVGTEVPATVRSEVSGGRIVPAVVVDYDHSGAPIYSSDPNARPVSRPVRGALPPGRTPIVTEPPPGSVPAPSVDRSGGRTVPAASYFDENGQRVYFSDPEAASVPRQIRGELPAGARFQIASDGTIIPVEQADDWLRALDQVQGRTEVPESGGGSVRAAVVDRDVDVTKPTSQAITIKQYSSDPNAADVPLLSDEEMRMLRVMREDIATFKPERGRLVRDPNDRNSSIYAYGGAGSRVADDMRVISGQHVSNNKFLKAIDDLLEGKSPTNKRHLAAIDAARGYLEHRPGYRGPQLPMEVADEGGLGAVASREMASGGGQPATVDDFEKFSAMFDDVEPGAVSGREPGEEGFIRPMLAARVGGALAGGAAGAASGDTPEERLGLGVAGAFVGATAPSLLRRALTPQAERLATRAMGRVVNKPGELVDAYRTRFGKVISADLAKEIVSPEYARTPESRREFGAAVHPASARMVDALVEDLVRSPVPEGSTSTVLLVAGAPGGGKTAMLKQMPLGHYDAVIEGSLRDPEAAQGLIQKLRDSGRDVVVMVVDRDIRKAWSEGVLSPERVSEGRVTPMDYYLDAHTRVPQAAVQVADTFANDPRVAVRVLRNENGGPLAFETVDALRNRAYNVGDVRDQLRRDTDALVEEGRISADVRDAAYRDSGGSGAQGRPDGPGGRDSRRPQADPLGRLLSDESGSVTTQLATHVAGGLGGAAIGAASADSSDDQLKRAAIYGAAGAIAPALFRRSGGATASRLAGNVTRAVEGEGVSTPARGIVSGPARSGQPRQDPMDGMDVFIGKFNPMVQSGIRERIAANSGYDAQRRGTISSRELGRFANEVRINVEKTLPKGTSLNAEAITAYARAVQQSQSKINALAGRVNAGTATDADIVALQAARADAEVLMKSLAGARSEAGRSLAAFRFLGGVLETGDVNLIRHVADSMRDEARQLANGLARQPNDPLVRYRWLQAQSKTPVISKLRTVYYANILSGIKTHERNVLGNVANIASELLVTPAAAAADAARSALTGAPRTVYLNELPAGLVGTIGGLERGWSDMLFTLRHGVSPDSLRRSLASGEVGKLDVPRVELAGGGANPFNWPGRALDAADALFRSTARNQELYRLAHTQATREGLTGDRFTQRVADLRAGLSPDAQPLQEQAAEYARRTVFQEKPGKIASWISQGNQVPVLQHVMPFVLPFVKTPANIFRQGLEFSPAGVLMQAARQGGRAGAQAQGRVVAGTLGAGYLAWLAATGRLSGNGPSDPAERAGLMESGWRPNSVKVGDSWVNYQLFQPVSVQAALIANAFESWNDEGAKPGDVPDLLAKTLARSANSFLDQSFLSGLFDFAEALKDPERSATRVIGRTAQSAVPFIGALRSVQQGMDPVVRQPRGTVETFKASLPMLSEQVPARVSRFGEPVVREGGPFRRAADPLNVSSEVHDSVADELRRLRVDLTLPAGRLVIEGAPLTREESEALKIAQGRAVRAAIERLVSSDGYVGMRDEQRVPAIKKAIGRARAEANETFRREAQRARRRGLVTRADTSGGVAEALPGR